MAERNDLTAQSAENGFGLLNDIYFATNQEAKSTRIGLSLATRDWGIEKAASLSRSQGGQLPRPCRRDSAALNQNGAASRSCQRTITRNPYLPGCLIIGNHREHDVGTLSRFLCCCCNPRSLCCERRCAFAIPVIQGKWKACLQEDPGHTTTHSSESEQTNFQQRAS